MGKAYAGNGVGWVPTKTSYKGTGTGYVGANRVFRQIGADGEDDWVQIWARPAEPPTAPILEVEVKERTRNQFNVRLTMPSFNVDGEFSRAVVKVGINATPNPPNITDGMYYTERDQSEPWSEWFTDQTVDYSTIPVNHTGTKTFPNEFQPNVTVPYNTNVTFSAWVQDEYGNWSEVATQTVRSLGLNELPAGGTLYTTVIAPTEFDEYSHAKNLWQFRPLVLNGQTQYCDPAWVRSSSNPYWWAHTGGGYQRQTYLAFANRLRTVLNAAYEVQTVTLRVKRRYDTSVNMSGGRVVDDADFFGARNARIHVWANKQSGIPTRGSTTDLIEGSDSIINMGTVLSGDLKEIAIPKSTWEHFLDGKGNSARSLCFYHPGTTGDSNDPYSISWAVPGTPKSGGGAKWNESDLAGHITVKWVGYDGNPFSFADPSNPNFKPLGI